MLRPGIYRHPDNGDAYRVRLNRAKTRTYTERWSLVGDRYEFVYEPRALQALTSQDRMPLEEARQISREAGQCLACARMLTDPESQAVGIGPTCARSWTYDQAVGTLNRTILPSARESVRARVAGDRVVITSQYDATIIGIIKTFEGARWDDRAGSWSLPRDHAQDLAEAFALVGIAHDDVAAIAMGWDFQS